MMNPGQTNDMTDSTTVRHPLNSGQSNSVGIMTAGNTVNPCHNSARYLAADTMNSGQTNDMTDSTTVQHPLNSGQSNFVGTMTAGNTVNPCHNSARYLAADMMNSGQNNPHRNNSPNRHYVVNVGQNNFTRFLVNTSQCNSSGNTVKDDVKPVVHTGNPDILYRRPSQADNTAPSNRLVHYNQ